MKKKIVLMSVCMSLLYCSEGIGGAINVTDSNITTSVVSNDSATLVRLTPPSPTAINNVSQTLSSNLNSEYSTWTFNSGGSSPGTFNVSTYDAVIDGNVGGGDLRVTYDNGTALSTGTELRWIQEIDTTHPLGRNWWQVLTNNTDPYIDPRPNDDNLPFYWTNTEIPGMTSGDTVTFTDGSRRGISDAPVRWNAGLYLAEYDGNEEVTILDGLSWGWEILANYDVSLDTFGSTPYDSNDFFHVNFNSGPSDVFLTNLSLDFTPVNAFLDPTDTPPGYAGSNLDFSSLVGLVETDITTEGLTDGSGSLAFNFADNSFGVGDSYNFGVDIDLWSNIDYFGATPDELNGLSMTYIFSDGYTVSSSLDKYFASSISPDWNLPQGTEPVPEPATLLLFGTGLSSFFFARRKKVTA